MLSKETFINSLNILQKLEKTEQLIYDSSEGCIQLYALKPYSDLLDMYVRVLEEAMEVEVDERFGSDISYFIYELEFGKKWKPESITDADGNSIDFSTAERLYDYIVSERTKE